MADKAYQTLLLTVKVEEVVVPVVLDKMVLVVVLVMVVLVFKHPQHLEIQKLLMERQDLEAVVSGLLVEEQGDHISLLVLLLEKVVDLVDLMLAVQMVLVMELLTPEVAVGALVLIIVDLVDLE